MRTTIYERSCQELGTTGSWWRRQAMLCCRRSCAGRRVQTAARQAVSAKTNSRREAVVKQTQPAFVLLQQRRAPFGGGRRWSDHRGPVRSPRTPTGRPVEGPAGARSRTARREGGGRQPRRVRLAPARRHQTARRRRDSERAQEAGSGLWRGKTRGPAGRLATPKISCRGCRSPPVRPRRHQRKQDAARACRTRHNGARG